MPIHRDAEIESIGKLSGSDPYVGYSVGQRYSPLVDHDSGLALQMPSDKPERQVKIGRWDMTTTLVDAEVVKDAVWSALDHQRHLAR